MPDKTQKTRTRGEVIESLPNTMFRVKLSDGRIVLTTPSGKMRRGFMRLLPGQKVIVEMTQYDVDRGRVVDLER